METALAILLTSLSMTAIIAGRYLITSGGFAWLSARRHPAIHAGRARQICREIAWSLASAIVYAVPAGIVAWGWQARGWTRIYDEADACPLWYLPISILAYLVAHDAWFYWTHRWMHRPGPFRIAHAVHHASRPPTAWAAMSFHPVEALTGAVVIPALVFVVPIHWGALLVVLGVMTLMGVTNHMGWEMFPHRLVEGRIGRWLITASHHQRHHRQYRCNYGLYFRFWDRLCHTDQGVGHFDHDDRMASDNMLAGRGGQQPER